MRLKYPLKYSSTLPQFREKITAFMTNALAIRRPTFSYLHLSLLSIYAPASITLDALTVHKYLKSALQQFLGLTGTSISFDILKIYAYEVWIRVAREDGSAVVAALGSWVGQSGSVSWRVRGRGDWLGAVVAQDGERKAWGD